MVSRPLPSAASMSGIILTMGTFWLGITMFYNALHHYHTLYYRYFIRLSTYPFSLSSSTPRPRLPLPPRPRKCWSESSHQIFPTILGHEFISITKDCICIFNVLFFFLFADPPVWPPRRSLSWRATPRPAPRFMSGEQVDRRERNIFWRNVPFRDAVWESWFQNHRESFHYSPSGYFWAA